MSKNIKPTVHKTADSFIESLKNDLSSYSSSYQETKVGSKTKKDAPRTCVYDKKKLRELDGEREGVMWRLASLKTLYDYLEEIHSIASYAYYTDDKTRNLKDDFLKIVGLASMINEDFDFHNRALHRQLDRYDEEIEANYGKEALAGLSFQITDEEGK